MVKTYPVPAGFAGAGSVTAADYRRDADEARRDPDAFWSAS